jgi:hypothetical protein
MVLMVSVIGTVPRASSSAFAQTATEAPPAPGLAAPVDGATVQDAWGEVELRWEAVPGADEYQVILNDGERTGPWITETSWSPGSLPEGVYRWTVQSRNAVGIGAPGTAYTFTVAPAAVAETNTGDSRLDIDEPVPFPLQQQAAWLNLAAASAIVATPLTVNGAGFAPGERVLVFWDDPASPPLLETAANDGGAWTEAVQIPGDVIAEHRIIARGDQSKVEAAGTVSIIPSIERPVASGLPGAEVGLLLQGFAAGETVDLRWGGEQGPSLATATTNDAGSGEAKIVLPETEPGAYDVVGLGQLSGGKALSAFRVEQPAAPEAAAPAMVAGGTMLNFATFMVTATVEGLIGGTTSSGRTIAPDDHFVSLPACTNTSCPWLEPGVEHAQFGQRVECGNLCYVKVQNPETGACSVAPVLETGPWFTMDNWWDPPETRWLNRQQSTVNLLPQGYTGADAAHDGLDVGFGRAPDGIGISNRGYAVGNRAAMDLANGTWQDVGFDLNTGIGTVVVTMLWQTGETPESASATCQPAPWRQAPEPEAPAETDAPAATGEPAPSDPAAPPPPATSGDGGSVVGTDGADGADGQSGQPGQDGQSGGDAVVTNDGGVKGDRDRRRDEKVKDKDKNRGGVRREARERRQASHQANGDASDDLAEALLYQQPVELEREDQDATDATAGASGEDGTINGVPRDTAEGAPAATDPGATLTPAGVTLPPPVPGLPGAPAPGQVTAPGIDPSIAGGIGATSELVFDAVSDTVVFTSAPASPQSQESLGLLATGGPQGAITLISFDVTGIAGGTVLSALLTFQGAGATGAPGGSVGVLYGYIAPDGLTANDAPSGESALNVHGVPAWFDWVEPGGLTAIDVTGSVQGDGAITFVLPGQSDATATMLAIESGVPPQLVLTVAMPA